MEFTVQRFQKWLSCLTVSMGRRITFPCLALGLSLWAFAPTVVAQGAGTRACPPNPTSLTAEQLSKVRRAAQDRGLLWRISRDGHSSWLYGTLHVGRAEWSALGPKVRGALDASDLLALELDAQNPRVLELIAQSMRRPSPPVPEALRRQLTDRLAGACVPPAALAQVSTVMQAVMLSMMAARWEGLHGEFGSETLLSRWAQTHGRKVVSLETVKRQFSALTPENEAMATDMVRSSLQQHDDQVLRPTLAKLASAWERGDADEIEGYERWCQCIRNDNDRRMMKRINDDRNPDMASAIDDLHRSGRRVFAAVGALHMTGAQALPKLMAQRGYAVERVSFSTR